MSGARILIVEDENIIVRHLTSRLRRLGYEVLAAVSTGEEAVVQAEATRPDLVLMDIRLAGEMDGVAAAAAIQSRQDVPVIYLTAYADTATLERAKITAPFGYLLKPFEVRDLHTTIEIALYKHRMEQRLRESETLYRTLVEASPDAIALTDLEGHFLALNHQFARMYGFETVEEVRGQGGTAFDLVVAEEREQAWADAQRVLAEGILRAVEYRARRKDGSGFVVEVSAAAVRGPDGRPQALVALSRDITARLQADEELRRYREHLEELVAERTEALRMEVAERRRAQEATQRRATELRALDALSRQMSASTTVEQVVTAALRGVADAVAPDLVLLYLRQGEKLRLRGICPDDAGLQQQLSPVVREGEGLCGLAAAAGRPAYSGALADDPRGGPDERYLSGMQSFAALPLLQGLSVLGILAVASTRPDDFRERASFLETLAGDVSVGLQKALLLEQTQQHAESLEETVTQRTRELQAERDRTRAILEAVGEAVIVTDTAGRVLYLNPAAVAMTGCSRSEALGQDTRVWLGEAPSAGFFDQVAEVLRAGQVWRGEIATRRKDGTLYDSILTVAPLFDPDDPRQLTGSVCAQRDITPLKEAERLKDQFVSNVSHELRTPLSIITLISGNLEALYETLDDARRQKMIRDLREQARVLDNLIGNVLEVSRIDSGRISQERSRINLVRLVREEVEKQRALAAKKSLELRVLGPRSLLLWGIVDQLRQVVRNLVNNAIKYTPDGGKVTCECRAGPGASAWGEGWPQSADLPAGRWAGVRVTDTGVGMAAPDLPHLFERFYRVQSQGSVPGTGLGLAIARELVELHGGHIAVASIPGVGSTFAVYLPIRQR